MFGQEYKTSKEQKYLDQEAISPVNDHNMPTKNVSDSLEHSKIREIRNMDDHTETNPTEEQINNMDSLSIKINNQININKEDNNFDDDTNISHRDVDDCSSIANSNNKNNPDESVYDIPIGELRTNWICVHYYIIGTRSSFTSIKTSNISKQMPYLFSSKFFLKKRHVTAFLFLGATTTNLPAGVLYRVKATYRYVREDSDELSFEAGDTINVVEYEDPEDQVSVSFNIM